MSEHTPGPWWTDGEYSEEEAGVAVIAANTDAGPLPGNPTRGMVAWSSELLPENKDRCAANARLIAAAPDLLVAAKLALTHVENIEAEFGMELGAGKALREAIAKAESGT